MSLTANAVRANFRGTTLRWQRTSWFHRVCRNLILSSRWISSRKVKEVIGISSRAERDLVLIVDDFWFRVEKGIFLLGVLPCLKNLQIYLPYGWNWRKTIMYAWKQLTTSKGGCLGRFKDYWFRLNSHGGKSRRQITVAVMGSPNVILASILKHEWIAVKPKLPPRWLSRHPRSTIVENFNRSIHTPLPQPRFPVIYFALSQILARPERLKASSASRRMILHIAVNTLVGC